MNNSKEITKETIKRRKEIESYYNSLFLNLFHNSIVVENLPSDLPKRYLLNELYIKGGICYDYKTKLYLPYSLMGVNQYGLPTRANLIPYSKGVLHRDIDDVCVLRANDSSTPIYNYIQHNIDKLVEIDMCIYQNLESIKTMALLPVESQSTLLSITNLSNQRRLGGVVAYVDKDLINKIKDSSHVMSTNSQYLIDKLLDDRTTILSEVFGILGINGSDIEKRERVQGIEIVASQNFAIDCINVLIQTFNYDAKFGGIDIRLKGNTNLSIINDKQFEEMDEMKYYEENSNLINKGEENE